MGQPCATDADVAAALRRALFQSKLKERQKFHQKRRTQRRREAKTGDFTPKYQTKKAWFLRKAAVPPEVLQAAVDRDKEIARYRRLLSTPIRDRKKKMAEKILEAIPALQQKLRQLMDDVQPHLDKVLSFDNRIRKVIDEIEFIRYLAANVRPPTDQSLQTSIKVRAKRIAFAQARIVLARQKMELRKIRGGNWGKHGGKKPLTKGE